MFTSSDVLRASFSIDVTKFKEYQMKIIVRAFVIALTITGAVASAHTRTVSTTSSDKIVVKTSSMPFPWCPPGVPDGCGIGK
jgi:hypothetical protein